MASNPEETAVGATIIALMKGVIYKENDETYWSTLVRRSAAVSDHFAQIGVEVIIDQVEGYAYLRTTEPQEGQSPLPSLIRRLPLTYHVSLLLVLLRKRLMEFDASGGEGKLVLERDQIIEMLRVFQEQSTNEAAIVSKAEATIEKVVKLGYLRALRGQNGKWEVPRIVKAYVDAETLSDFSAKLATYRGNDE